MDLAQSPRPLRICADIPVRGGVEISMPPVFIASENDARHLPRCQLMHRSGRGRDLLAANAQLPAQGNRRVHLLSPYCCGRPSIRRSLAFTTRSLGLLHPRFSQFSKSWIFTTCVTSGWRSLMVAV